jgi:hypothetical protein
MSPELLEESVILFRSQKFELAYLLKFKNKNLLVCSCAIIPSLETIFFLEYRISSAVMSFFAALMLFNC